MFTSELWFRIDLPAVLRTVAWNVSQPYFAAHFFGTSYLIYEKTMHLLITNKGFDRDSQCTPYQKALIIKRMLCFLKVKETGIVVV